MKPSPCLPGRYLHSWWADAFGITGEGFAPLSAPGHQFITKAALAVLPEVRQWLGGEADLLIWTYCGFPDMNWHAYGNWQAACDYLPEQRHPDTRREWDISRYCDYNDLTKAGEWFGHHYPSAGLGSAKNYRRACAAAQQRHGRDAVRLLGPTLHFLQDCGAPPHAINLGPPLHRPAENLRDPARIAIPGYRPRATFEIAECTRRLCEFAVPRAQQIVRRLEADIAADVLDLQLACANACAEATADALADFHRRFATRLDFRSRPVRPGVELLHNGDFARADDEPSCPTGWVMKWWDRTDRKVVIGRRVDRGTALVATGKVRGRVACLPAWPRAVRAHPGETYTFSAQTLSSAAAGGYGLYAELYDDATRKVGECFVPAAASSRWRRTVSRITVPEGAALLRVGLAVQDTPAEVRFTALSLRRERQGRPGA